MVWRTGVGPLAVLMVCNELHISHGRHAVEEANYFKAPNPEPSETTRILAIDFARAKAWITSVGNYSTTEQ